MSRRFYNILGQRAIEGSALSRGNWLCSGVDLLAATILRFPSAAVFGVPTGALIKFANFPLGNVNNPLFLDADRGAKSSLALTYSEHWSFGVQHQLRKKNTSPKFATVCTPGVGLFSKYRWQLLTGPLVNGLPHFW